MSIFDTLHALELPHIIDLQRLFNGGLNPFFIALNQLDTPVFFVILILGVWIARWQRIGITLLLLSIVSALTNFGLKALFALDRPCYVDPSIGKIVIHGYGFPSGAAQSAYILAAFLLSISQRWYSVLLALSYFCLLSFSRIYLGVHYFSDVFAGWIVGMIIYELITQASTKISSSILLIMISIASTAAAIIPNTPSYLFGISGLCCGSLVSNRFALHTAIDLPLYQKIISFLIGVVSTYILWNTCAAVTNLHITYLVTSFWVGGIYPIICYFIEQKRSATGSL